MLLVADKTKSRVKWACLSLLLLLKFVDVLHGEIFFVILLNVHWGSLDFQFLSWIIRKEDNKKKVETLESCSSIELMLCTDSKETMLYNLSTMEK